MLVVAFGRRVKISTALVADAMLAREHVMTKVLRVVRAGRHRCTTVDV